jgi:glycosyltransferase involved in cell wall biosynthesis
MPTMSIIIPTYNEERYLPRLLKVLAQQTRQPDQIIVADAFSTDQTRAIAAEHGCLVVDGGLPGVGRNAGAKLATGECLVFFDADAVIEDDHFLDKAITEFEQRHLDLATADIYLQHGSKLEHFAHEFYNRYAHLWGSWHPHIPGFCFFIRRSVFEEVGGFDETVVLAEDHDLANRAGKVGKFGFLETVKIGVNDRRLRRDGWLKLLPTYILAEFHLLFLGPIRHHMFKYEFGYDQGTDDQK